MLCEKCHTAIDAHDASTANEAACSNCGTIAKKRNRKRSKAVRVVIVVFILAVFGAYFALQHLDFIDFDPMDMLFGGGTAAAPEEVPPASAVDSEDANLVGANNYETTTAVVRRSDEEHQAMLATHLTAVEAYINLHVHTNALLTLTGFLYNATASEFVSTSRLIDLGFLNDSFDDEDVLVLYLRPMDLAGFNEVELAPLTPAVSEVLTVFLAYQTPLGFGLHSNHGTTMIFRENLNEVLTSYSPDNGEILRLTMASPVYQLVLEMITTLHPNVDGGNDVNEQIFIRHLAIDETHGFVAFSTSANTNAIANIIFAIDFVGGYNEDYDESHYMVLNIITTAAFEVTRMPNVVINGIAPSFNFELMPLYDIAPPSINFMDVDEPMFVDLLATLEDMGVSSTLLVSASYPFAYIVTATGQALLGIYSDGWQVEGVASWRTAEEVIAEHGGPQPFYILWQQ